jgi:translation initiation factor 2 subunit 3
MVGHVDHGKTSLTKALTGKWTDTHSEEIKRGISIRIGYADTTFFKCKACKGAEAFSASEKCPACGAKGEELRRVSFVDAPGHETLMTTMLSGAALMNGAVLVIAANEPCPQPRTAEHLMALKAAGIERIVVAQNKIDLVDKEQALKNRLEIEKFLGESGYENIAIVPTAANFGTNIDLLIEAIEKSIPSPKLDEKKTLKMFVARSFDINKPGSLPAKLKGGVVGGSIMQGKAKIGDEIEILPGVDEKPLKTSIASLHTDLGAIEEALPGGLIAIGTLLDPNLAKNDQLKGQVVGVPGSLPQPAKRLSLKVFPFKRLLGSENAEIRASETVVLSIGTMSVVGTVARASRESMEFVLKNSVVVEKGQKVAVSKRQKSGWRLAAYGIAN